VEDGRAGEIQIWGGDEGGVVDGSDGIIGAYGYSEWGVRAGEIRSGGARSLLPSHHLCAPIIGAYGYSEGSITLTSNLI
jgi:hypothetical protein